VKRERVFFYRHSSISLRNSEFERKSRVIVIFCEYALRLLLLHHALVFMYNSAFIENRVI